VGGLGWGCLWGVLVLCWGGGEREVEIFHTDFHAWVVSVAHPPLACQVRHLSNDHRQPPFWHVKFDIDLAVNIGK